MSYFLFFTDYTYEEYTRYYDEYYRDQDSYDRYHQNRVDRAYQEEMRSYGSSQYQRWASYSVAIILQCSMKSYPLKKKLK